MAITVKHTKVSTIPDGDDTSVVRPSDWNADHQLVGTVPVANGGTGAATLTGYVKGNGTSAMTAATTIPNTDVTGLGTASTKDAGVANGVATLDGSGTVPISQLPAAVLGALSYQGTWNASTNTPTLVSSVGTKGYYYVVSVAGSTNLNGITDWQVGDWAVYNGSTWQKIDNTDAVTSVNGYTGTVVLTTTDVAEGTNQYFTTARARTSVSAGTGVSYNSTTGVITNSAPDQTVVLTAGTGISTSGTYPNFTITNTAPSSGGTVTSVSGTAGRITSTGGNTPVIDLASGVATAGTTGSSTLIPVVTIDTYGRVTGITTTSNPQGTVTSVTGTAPVVSSGGNTPAISMAAANTTTNGYLTSTDWNTFNGKSNTNGTVTSVAALTIGTTGTDLSSTVATGTTTPVITLQVPTASATNRGALSAADWTTFNNKSNTTGTVTSVSATVPSFLSVSGSPITTSGTLALTYSGTALPILNGGTGQTTASAAFNALSPLTTAGDILYGGVSGAGTRLAIGTTGQILRVVSGNPAWGTDYTGTVTSVGGTGTINGLTLTGTVTTSGNLTLGGTLDLSSPPAIGGTAAAAITGTTITATKFVGVSGGTF